MARLMNTGYIGNLKVNTDINQKNDPSNKKKPTI